MFIIWALFASGCFSQFEFKILLARHAINRHTSWHFSSLLSVSTELAHCISGARDDADDVVRRIQASQIENKSHPDHVRSVKVRYALSDLNPTCSKLPFEGYVQTKRPIDIYILQKWFSSAWSPVGGHCSRPDAYQSFCAPHPDYVRLALHGKEALKKGGRPKKLKEVTLIPDNASSDQASSKKTIHPPVKSLLPKFIHYAMNFNLDITWP